MNRWGWLGRAQHLGPRGRRLVQLLLLATLLAHGVYAGSADVADNDVWWHLATGRYIVEHGEIPTRDVFSYTFAGAPWFNPEWLSQVLYFQLFHHGGGTALALFKLVVASALFPLAAWLAWRRSGSLVFSVGAAVAAAFVCRPFLDIRPQLFSFVGALVLLATVDAYRRGARVAILALLPMTMVLWVNLHAGFIYGLGLLMLLAACEVVKAVCHLPSDPMPRARAGWLAAATMVAGLACLVNHEGARALTFPFDILGADDDAWRTIIEWAPPVLFHSAEFSPAFFGYFLVAMVLLALTLLVLLPARFDLSDFACVAATAPMALLARRFVPLFALVSVPFAARSLSLLRERFLPSPGAPELSRARGAAGVALLCVAALAVLLLRAVPEARRAYAGGLFDGMVGTEYFPRDAVQFLRLNPQPGHVFAWYAWGGYLLYELPERGVFIDPRAHYVYPGAFYREHLVVEFGQPGWSDVLDRYQVALVLWPSNSTDGFHLRLLKPLSASPSWTRIYDDGFAAIFAHVARGRDWVERYRAFELHYPDVPDAQVFLANAYLQALQFEPARLHLRDTLRRYPSVESRIRAIEQRLLAAASTQGRGDAWFGVGFYRDVRADVPGAAEAYRTALEQGLGEPYASYVRQALARLEGEALGGGAPRARGTPRGGGVSAGAAGARRTGNCLPDKPDPRYTPVRSGLRPRHRGNVG